jgi:RNA polymerase-binding transcription factor DksA
MHYFTIEQREALQHQLKARAAALHEEIDDDVRADLNAEPQAVALALDVAELSAVKAALARIHTPEFGLCGDCKAEIPFSRLSANPAAVRCFACQAKRESA